MAIGRRDSLRLDDPRGTGGNPYNRRTVLWVVALTSFLIPFMASSINVALPTIGKEFKIDAILLGWIATSYILSCAVFTVPFGRLADIYGRKKIFTLGILCYTVFSLLCSLSTSIYFFLSSRVLQGIGSAMVFATSLALLTSAFPLHERGKALGISVAFTYSGMSLGPFLGGFLTHYWGWRSIFLSNTFLGALVFFLSLWKIRDELSEPSKERFDFVGAVLYGLTLVSMICGFSLLPESAGVRLIFLSGIAMILFLTWESRIASPILNIGLFSRSKVFAFSSLAALIHYSSTFAVTLLLSLFLQYIKGLNPRVAGSILIFQPLIMAIFSPIAGRLSDRIEPRLIASAGMSITGIGILSLSLLEDSTSLNYIITSLVVLGFGFAFFSSPNTNAIMSSVDKRYYGVASGMVATMRMIGQMLSMGLVMLVFSLKMGKAQITPDVYPSFIVSVKTSFRIFSVLCVLGIFASLARGRLRSKVSNSADMVEK